MSDASTSVSDLPPPATSTVHGLPLLLETQHPTGAPLANSADPQRGTSLREPVEGCRFRRPLLVVNGSQDGDIRNRIHKQAFRSNRRRFTERAEQAAVGAFVGVSVPAGRWEMR